MVRMTKAVFALLLAIGVASCKMPTLGPYTSPAVAGRVLRADTQQPLAGVRVTRGARAPEIGSRPKGAELLQQPYAAHTGRDGRFHFLSERALTVFRPSGWQFVTLSFSYPGYQTVRTNLSILSAGTNTPNGEPLIQTGDVLLRPTKP